MGPALNSRPTHFRSPSGNYDIKGIVFDFDGVIADSELPANFVLAQKISELGIQA